MNCIFIGRFYHPDVSFGQTGVAVKWAGRNDCYTFWPHGDDKTELNAIPASALYFPKNYTPTRPDQKKDL